MKILIVDDEPKAREVLLEMMKEIDPELSVMLEAKDITQAFNLIKAVSPDLVFLDIEMNEGTGFDLLKKLDKINFQIIFVTAYHQYAIEAIKVSACDYLLKPASFKEVKIAYEKAKLKKLNELNSDQEIKKLLENLLKPQPNKISLNDQNGVTFVELNDIVRCESDNNYTYVFLQNGDKHLISKTLKDFEESLSNELFFRVHNSHLINMNYVSRFDKKESIIFMKDGITVAVSKRKKQEFLERMKC